MFNHRFEQIFEHPKDQTATKQPIFFYWFLLTFNGGFINAGGFLATGNFVSHVTGFATLFGVELSKNQTHVALGLLSVPLFFLMGAFIAGLLIDRPLYYGKKPHFDRVMAISAFCLFLAASGSVPLQFGSFGIFGLKQKYLLMVLLCLASGLQNGAITSSSGRSVRTTHLTGLTTDLGLGLARLFTLNLSAISKKEKTNALPFLQGEWHANFLRIGTILFFIFGSAMGAWIFVKLGYKGFIFPGFISSYAAWQGFKTKKTHTYT